MPKKKKNSKKTKKKSKKRKIIKKRKQSIKIKKKSRKTRKRKKLKTKKKAKRIKITSKIRSFGTGNQLTQLKELTVKKVLSFIFQPIVKFFTELKKKRKQKRLKKIDFERREKERQIKEEEVLRKEMIEYELKNEIRMARMRSQDLKKFIREDQAILRREQADRNRRFLESIRLQKKIESYRIRELKQIKAAEMAALKEERDDYRPVLDRIEKIKKKYNLIREQKIREKLQSLGLVVGATDTKESLIEKQRAYEEHRQKIELILESFYRSANSLVFQLNKKYIPRHKSILRCINRLYENSECLIRYDDEVDENFLVLVYLENSDEKQGKIIVENKSNPERYETKSFLRSQIFQYSDYLVESLCNHIDRERQKKAS